jgi:L-malate glycosyltransferase
VKILLLNYEYPPLGGGGGVASSNLAGCFSKLGHKVAVITSKGGGLLKKETVNNVNIYRVFTPLRSNKIPTPIISMLFYPITGFLKVCQLSRKFKFDIISCHFAIPTGLLGVLVKFFFKKKLVLSLYGGDIYDPTKKTSPHKNYVLKLIVKIIIDKSDLVIVESTDLAQSLKKFYAYNKSFEIIPVGFSPPALKYKKPGVNKKKLKIIAVGRLIKRKGFLYLVRALKNIKNIKAVIIGEGPEKEILSKEIVKNNLQKKVKLLGWVAENEKWQNLFSSDLFILSSIHEGFGIVLQEAMFAGLPIISTNKGGQMDLLTAKNAILIPPKSTVKIKNAIEYLKKHPRLRARLGENNRKNIKNYYILKIAEKYVKLFRGVVNE